MISLAHVADVTVTVGSPVEVGSTPAGVRRVIPITGGEVRGPKLNGRVLPMGADFQIVRSDGVAELDARYAIETSDGAVVYIHNTGLRHGPAEAMAKLQRGEAVDPALIYFRTCARFETAAAEYLWLNRYLFAGDGVRRPDRVEIAIHQIL